MFETFILLFGVLTVAGSWIMLNGVAAAPLGFEDEDGFHYLPARSGVEVYETAERQLTRS